MDDESEQALLIGNPNKSNIMMYTNGPTLGGVGAGLEDLPTPPSYENVMQNEPHRHSDNPGMKSFSGRDPAPNHDRETFDEDESLPGGTLLEQFHADALKQVGFGKYQLIVIFCTGMALAAYVGYFFSLFFIMPSIDLEFCMTIDERIGLLEHCLGGAAIGVLLMTSLAEVSGRKKALCTYVFIFIASCLMEPFMPTGFCFMFVRVFNSFCGASIIVVGATYVCEMCPSSSRGRALGLFVFIGSFGGLVAASLSYLLLPRTGEELFNEYQTHFSGWRTYLLAMALPFTIILVCLLFLSESPRWMLDVGKEMHALKAYQKMYNFNHSGGTCSFTEMELPRVLPDTRYFPTPMKLKRFAKIFKIWTILCHYQPFNIVLFIIWYFAMCSVFSQAVSGYNNLFYLEKKHFLADTIQTVNATIENAVFDANLINNLFLSSHFENCTFNRIILSYIRFENCTFLNSNFHGVISANTTFVNSFFDNVNFIDTNLRQHNFKNCNMTNTNHHHIDIGCDQEFDLNTFFYVLCYDVTFQLIFVIMLTSLLVGETIKRIGSGPAAILWMSLAGLLCAIFPFHWKNGVIYWQISSIVGSIIAALIALTLYSIEYNYMGLRCWLLSTQFFCGFIGACCGANFYHRHPFQSPALDSLIQSVVLFSICVLGYYLKPKNRKVV